MTQAGAKAVENLGTTGTALIAKTGTAQTDATSQIYIYAATGGHSGDFGFKIRTDTTTIAYIFCSSTQVQAYDNVTPTVVGSYSADTWFFVQVEWESVNHKFRANVNGGTWTNWLTPESNNGWTTLNNIQLRKSDVARAVYWDSISEAVAVSTGKKKQDFLTTLKVS